MQRLLAILFWSILSAAFIGPGTVTSASKAGHGFGVTLLWALTFSTIACIVLQEASARITIHSGKELGQAIRERFAGSALRVPVLLIVFGAIVVGCAAYQAGNILGGVAGARLLGDLPAPLLTLVMGLVAGLLLWFGSIDWIAKVLGGVVALMGVTFLVTAAGLLPDLPELVGGALVPRSPQGAGLLVMALIGTTVVPYNLFLGSGLARTANRDGWRFGLIVAVGLGGLISMGVVVVGSSLQGEFGFEALSRTLTRQLGDWAGPFFAIGLFCAGLSSAVTAPLAAAITARSLFGKNRPIESSGSGERTLLFRGTWIVVLLTGVGFGVFGQKPIPVILLAQALNGVLLPLVAVLLLLIVNDPNSVGRNGLNGALANTLLSLVVTVTVLLGLTNVLKAAGKAFGWPLPAESTLLTLSAGLSVLMGIALFPALRRRRRMQV